MTLAVQLNMLAGILPKCHVHGAKNTDKTVVSEAVGEPNNRWQLLGIKKQLNKRQLNDE